MDQKRLDEMNANLCMRTMVCYAEDLVPSLTEGSMGRALTSYLNDGFTYITRTLEHVKNRVSITDTPLFVERIHEFFRTIQGKAHKLCARADVKMARCFSRMGRILCCLIGYRKESRLSARAGVHERASNPVFWRKLVDRICDYMRQSFEWLRDVARTVDASCVFQRGPVPLGPWAAKFVEIADTLKGIILLRNDYGKYEVTNLTESEWNLVMPLLVTQHPRGLALLGKRPQERLSRHDNAGDAIRGELRRFCLHIQPEKRGRGGTGYYFLSPAVRSENTVDGKTIHCYGV